MVNGGTDELRRFVVAQFEGDRIRIPARLAEQAHLSGLESATCWLFVVTPGRYRLLSENIESAREDLSKLLESQAAAAIQGGALDGTGSNERAAIRARLIPTTLSSRPSWRLIVPREASLLVPAAEEHSFVFLLIVAGYLELWFPDTLGRALRTPASDLL